MIVLTMPLQGEKAVELLNGQEGLFTFKEKKGMKYYFETSLTDQTAAARQARELIKKQPWGSVLYFQAEAV